MNKAMEHFAYALPSVAFDLVVTTVSGGDCTRYVESGDLKAFADEVERLLYNSDLRAEIGMRARQRVVSELDRQPKSMSRSLLKCAASRGHPFRGNRMLATSTPTKLRPRQACVFHQSADRKRSVATPDSPQGRDARRTQAQRVPIKVFASLNLLFRRPFTRHDPAMPARRQCIRVDGIAGRFGR